MRAPRPALLRLARASSGRSTAIGSPTAADKDAMVSLGTVFYEPLWIFHRGLDASLGFEALRGKRLAIGLEGSGTHALAGSSGDVGLTGAGLAAEDSLHEPDGRADPGVERPVLRHPALPGARL